MNAKEYVEQMLTAIQNGEYNEYLELLETMEEDMDNVSDEEWDRLNQCGETIYGFFEHPQGYENDIIIALRWYLE